MKTLRNTVVTLAAVLGVCTANACTISYYSLNDQVSKSIKANGGFEIKNYNQVCAKLNKANAKFLIDAGHGVASQRAVAFAYVTVMDKTVSAIAYTSMGYSIQLNTDANTNKAEQILAEAVYRAIDSLDLDDAIQELNAVRKELGVGAKADK